MRILTRAEALPSWYPAWQNPGVIVAIPSSGTVPGGGSFGDSSLLAAQEARVGTSEDWTPPDDVIAGGSLWPYNLFGYSGGTVAYMGGQPYLCVMGGGHLNGPDNSIYAFGPLYGPGADNPQWSQLSSQSRESHLRTCTQHNADGRPTARHTSGDFSYGAGKICMLWMNSVHCGPGGVSRGVDVYDVASGDWDEARGISHPDTGDFRRIKQHSNSVYVPTTGLFYSITGQTIGAYNPFGRTVDGVEPRSWRNEGTMRSGGVGGDSMCCPMGDMGGGLADTVFAFDRGPGSSTEPQKINVRSAESTSWATADYPRGSAQAVAYDSHQERLYALNSGVSSSPNNRTLEPGTRDVAWVSVHGDNPTWNHETFHGDTPPQQVTAGTYGRWSYVKELRGFVVVNHAGSSVYFYRVTV
ncbi:MAG: hypothetical protein AAGF12_00275 [Myxococcota bacterium]